MTGPLHTPGFAQRSGAGPLPRLQDILIRALEDEILETGVSEQAFGERLVRAYHASVSPALRSHDFPSPDDDTRSGTVYEKDRETRGTYVRRIRRRARNMPVEMVGAWVQALSGVYAERCGAQVARYFGFLGVRVQAGDVSAAEDTSHVGRINQGTADALAALTPLIADAQFNLHDLPHAPDAVSRLLDLSARCHETAIRICHQTGYQHPVARNSEVQADG